MGELEASNGEKLWKLGRRKMIATFAMSRWGVQNENRAWRGLIRLLSDRWFLHRLLEFTQGLRNFSKVAKWVRTFSNFVQFFAKLGV